MLNKETWIKSDGQPARQIDFCNGIAVAFSDKAPHKETPNEDSAGLFAVSETQGVLVVSDGVGGANAGDRASETIVKILAKNLKKCGDSADALRSVILDSVEQANEEVLSWGNGAAATLAVVTFFDGWIRTFHAGDSIILLTSNRGKIRHLTVAHSPVAMAVESGLIDEAEAIEHEDRNLISNCVGSREMRIEIGPKVKMQRKDTLIIASDGLFDNFLTEDIVDSLRTGQLLDKCEQILANTKHRMLNPNDDHPSKSDDLTLLCFRQG